MYEYNAWLRRVVDGDTYDLFVDLGFRISIEIRVRLEGGDTPEVRGDERPAGLAASQFVSDWFSEGKDRCILRTQKTGKYGRWLGQLIRETDGSDLRIALGEAGHLK